MEWEVCTIDQVAEGEKHHVGGGWWRREGWRLGGGAGGDVGGCWISRLTDCMAGCTGQARLFLERRLARGFEVADCQCHCGWFDSTIYS